MRRRLFALAVLLQAGAFACLAVAYLRRNDVTIEGGYFNRATGNDSGGVAAVWNGPVTPWLVAAGVLLLAALVAFVLDRRAARAEHASP